ncbi:hypothetical protein SDC9_200525 [bioreactor metagenome]|uniref:Uncharacterized protein n=1 Tax=bioreactor metagenome TaxID=1076179 RepID=A0A645IPQ8_9ZZZZ
MSAQGLEDARRAHSAANTHGDQGVGLAGALQMGQRLAGKDAAGGAQGVAQGNGAAVGVYLFRVQLQRADAGNGLGGKGLVELNDVHADRSESRQAHDLRHRLQRSDAHDLRRNAHSGKAGKARQGRSTQSGRHFGGCQHHKGRAVAELGGVARCDQSVLQKGWR